MNRITKMLYSAKSGVTILLMNDGSNYALPVIRDPHVLARFCGSAREGKWKLTMKPEGIDLLMKMDDLEVQEMSF